MSVRRPRPRWHDWVERWDRQQTAYIPHREQRFETMCDIVAALGPKDPKVLDLACGPGSISRRVLDRFPRGRSVAVDFDPVLLELGRRTLKRFGERIRWVEADLRDATWTNRLTSRRFDAVLSTTALHWLTPAELTRTYRQLRTLLRRGGVVMNGDSMAFERRMLAFRQLARDVNHTRTRAARIETNAEDWDTWWRRLRAEPTLAPLFALRDERFPKEHHTEHDLLEGFHETALKEAGFREVGVIWQDIDNRILLGIA
ncbi:MAG: class I SAM-dependent methyltransferase [Thermoplasmata archaeon]|nr:class I SAM-dependent methyltransferase [Thermoplasmata archaeon]